jgi:hypothetical protein
MKNIIHGLTAANDVRRTNHLWARLAWRYERHKITNKTADENGANNAIDIQKTLLKPKRLSWHKAEYHHNAVNPRMQYA